MTIIGSMYYYQIWVRSNKYHSSEPLTYKHPTLIKTGSIVRIFLQHAEINGLIIGKIERPRFQTKEISFVYNLPTLNSSQISLIKWLIDYYPSNVGVLMSHILPVNINTESIKKLIMSKNEISNLDLPKLTTDQSSALNSIADGSTTLIRGKTGSGKTRIYLEIAKKQFLNNKSSIILTPEISLTSQLFKVFNQQFKDNVFVVHSKLTPKEKQSIWLRCLISQQPIILIGPRSALFYPINNLGLIVMDESHENSYKEEQQPYYQTIRVASKLSQLNRATLILGSATPNITDYFLATNKNVVIVKLDRLAIQNNHAKNNISIIDLKDKSKFTDSRLISDDLLKAITKSLAKKEQSLIYLNRRGTARIIFCDNCGWEKLCKNCNLPLAYHADQAKLICHICGYQENTLPSVCPICKNGSIIYKSAGTKAINEELQKLFPMAKIARFDSDNKKNESFSNLYEDVLSSKIDILIGTQTIAKGLDLPKLTTVGLIQADTSLYIPDYVSKERTFQLISQVLGRINRGHLEGQAIIQTYNPDSKIIQYAIKGDYDKFYQEELEERRIYQFPPFFNLLKLGTAKSSPARAEKTANNLKQSIKELGLNIIIDGPSPAFHEKYQNKYHWQLIIKSPNRSNLIKIIKTLPSSWNFNLDPNNLL